MDGAPRGAVASPDATSPTRGDAARKRRREADASGRSLGATEYGGPRAKRETSEADGDDVVSVPLGRGYPTLCRGAVRDWPALRAWTRHPPGASGVSYPRLRELVGDREVHAMVGSERGRFDGAPTRHESVKLTVSAFLDYACAEDATAPPLCLAQVPLYDTSRTTRETTPNAEPLRALWDSGDVWPVPRVFFSDDAPKGGPKGGSIRVDSDTRDRASFGCRYVLNSANLWVSPGGSGPARRFNQTVSSAHFDDHENVLCVLAGSKTVRLWSPLAGLEVFTGGKGVRFRNPGDDGGAYNHEQKRVFETETARRADTRGEGEEEKRETVFFKTPFKSLKNAEAETLVARPGDAVYIPRGWWHEVASAANTVAVNLWYRSAEDDALDRLEADGRDDDFFDDDVDDEDARKKKRTTAWAGAAVATARRATRALSEHHRRSFVRSLRRVAASDAFRERARKALVACFTGDDDDDDESESESEPEPESSEPSVKQSRAPGKKKSPPDPEAFRSRHLAKRFSLEKDGEALSVLRASRLILALANPVDAVLDALYDAARADPESVERRKLTSFARRLRDAGERVRVEFFFRPGPGGGSRPKPRTRINTADDPPFRCFRGDRDLTHACVAAELLTSAFESRFALDAFEDGGKTKRRRNFFETFYGAFAGEEANSFSRALHFLRSVSAERATLRVSEALGLAEATPKGTTRDSFWF